MSGMDSSPDSEVIYTLLYETVGEGSRMSDEISKSVGTSEIHVAL